jgi:hypothetical protein
MPKDRAEKILTNIQIAQSAITIFGLIVGGTVATYLFFGQREPWPHLNISIETNDIGLNIADQINSNKNQSGENARLVSVVARLDNVGKVRAKIALADLFVERVDPAIRACPVTGATKHLEEILKPSISSNLAKGDPTYPWCTIRNIRQIWPKKRLLALESGESHDLYFEFLLPPDIKVIRLFLQVADYDNANLITSSNKRIGKKSSAIVWQKAKMIALK